MNRQIIFKLIAVFFVSIYMNSAQAGSISVDTNPGGVIDPSRSVSIGSFFDVNILVDNVSDFAGFQFELGFDPLVLAANGIVSGDIFGADTVSIDSSFNADPISFSETTLALSGLNITVPTILATIHFQAIGAGTASILDLKNSLLLDSLGDPIASVTENDGLITSSQASVKPVPEASLVLLLSLALLSLIGTKRKATLFSVAA